VRIVLGLLALGVLLLWEAWRNRPNPVRDLVVTIAADPEPFVKTMESVVLLTSPLMAIGAASVRAAEEFERMRWHVEAVSSGLMTAAEVRTSLEDRFRTEYLVVLGHGRGHLGSDRLTPDSQVVEFDEPDYRLERCWRCGSEIRPKDEVGLCDRCKAFLRSL
jgi:hypothetical protein